MIPEQEINASERDQFWQREELEEKQRLEEERSRRDREQERLELERRSREEKESQLREAQVGRLLICYKFDGTLCSCYIVQLIENS